MREILLHALHVTLFGFGAINFLKTENSETQNASDHPCVLVCLLLDNSGINSVMDRRKA